MIQLNLSAADRAALQAYLKLRPPGDDQAALFRAYGDFRPRAGAATLYGADAAWVRNNLVAVPLGLNLPGTRSGTVDLHRAVVAPVRIAMREIIRLGLAPALHRWNGAWNVRQMRTGEAWSLHSWAVAFDLNAASNGQGAGPGSMDPRVVQVFEMCGLHWGGRWSASYVDPMHFQCTKPLPGVPVPAWQDAAAKS